MDNSIPFHDGWKPEPRSPEHKHDDSPGIRELLEGLGLDRAAGVPSSVDLRRWCSPAQYQGLYNTCQSHVVAGMLEFLETRTTGSYVPASRLFLYQTTRRLVHEEGDPGLYIRNAIGALRLLGAPPEAYYPYLDPAGGDPRLDQAPDAFAFALARDFGALESYRLDPEGRSHADVLAVIRQHCASDLPVSLGFPLYAEACYQSKTNGEIPFAKDDELVGTHAIMVVGYDDEKRIENQAEGDTYTGAFLIRNSWGEQWGLDGYGWLSYEYLTAGHASDVWCMLHPKWVETGKFDLDLEDVVLHPAAVPNANVAKKKPAPAG